MLYPCFIQPTTRTIAYTLLISVYIFRHIIFARGISDCFYPVPLQALEFNPGRTVTAFGLTCNAFIDSHNQSLQGLVMPFLCRCIPSSFAASVIPKFAFQHGDRGGSRTRDSQIKSLLLYHLSYTIIARVKHVVILLKNCTVYFYYQACPSKMDNFCHTTFQSFAHKHFCNNQYIF